MPVHSIYGTLSTLPTLDDYAVAYTHNHSKAHSSRSYRWMLSIQSRDARKSIDSTQFAASVSTLPVPLKSAGLADWQFCNKTYAALLAHVI